MLLDIGIPCFNDSSYLLKCLESIDKQFVNNYDDIIVWVVDDDSLYSEEYRKVISQFTNFKIHLITMLKNSGPGNCRNEVIKQGSADWITFVDDDDYFIDNPLQYSDAFKTNAQIIRSCVDCEDGRPHVGPKDTFNCVFGSIFNRKFLKDNNLMFLPNLGIIGTEDSIFLLLATACASAIHIIPSFITHVKRKTSQYTLVSTASGEGYAISLIPLCNICEIATYKSSIKNLQIIWDALEDLFITLKNNLNNDTMINEELRNYYLILLYLLFFKTVREFFPTSESIKPYIKGTSLLPELYCAYHFCELESDVLYYQYHDNEYVNLHNLMQPLSQERVFLSLHFPSVYQGIIKYSCTDMVKRGRKEKGLPEKYWNF